jgi:hypothetical protein
MASNIRFNPASSPAIRVALAAALFAALPAAGRAANNCPWINEATASGLLGADAVGSYTDQTSTRPAVCAFIQSVSGMTRVLRIAVIETPGFRSLLDKESRACATAAEPLRAIGNEAISCSLDDRRKPYAERVIGRVRDQVFTITLSTTRKDDSILNREERKARVLIAAEQVSGNLF